MKSLVTVLFIILALGCKMNYSFTGADIPGQAKTFSVETFEIRAPLASPVAAQVLTETLKDLLQAQTPLNVTRSDGDVQYSGAIIGYDVQPVAIQSNETAALNRLTMTISLRYVNTFDQHKNVEQSISRFADYNSAQDLAVVESELLETLSGQLAQDIFDRTLGSW